MRFWPFSSTPESRQERTTEEKGYQLSGKNRLAVCILVAAVIADAILSNVSDITDRFLDYRIAIAIFAVVAGLIFLIGLRILVSARQAMAAGQSVGRSDAMSGLKQAFRAVAGAQYAVIAITGLIIVQMVYGLNYSPALLASTTTIGYVLGSAFMAFLSYKFFSWYRSKTRNFMILTFGMATAAIAIAAFTGIVSQNALLLENSASSVGPDSSVEFPKTSGPASSQSEALAQGVYAFSLVVAIVAYFLVWAASAMLLRHYSKKLGSAKFWSVIVLPLISFFTGLAPIMMELPVSNTYFDPGMLPFRLIAISGSISGGILFGVAFLAIARSLARHATGDSSTARVVYYLKISAVGITLLVTALAANIAHGSFPPFGAPTYSFVGTASYVFMLGIYLSAISVSKDIKLRSVLRKIVSEEGRLLDGIGSATNEQDVQKKVSQIARRYSDQIAKETADMQPSMIASEEAIRKYLEDVIDETQKARKDSQAS